MSDELDVTNTGAATQEKPADGAPALAHLEAACHGAVVSHRVEKGATIATISRDRLVEVATSLRDAGYTLPVFVTVVDWLEREPRFDMVYQLYSIDADDRIRVIVPLSEHDAVVPSLEKVYAGMDWHEREAFDLFGIRFDGHHDLKRILMPEDWDGHPLRKDYISFGEPVAFTHNLEWALPAQERPDDLPGAHR